MYLRTPELAPDNLEARVALVKFYLLQRKLNEAASDIDFILQKEPQNIEALLLLAGLRELEKKPHEAIVIFRKIIALDSRNEPAYRGLARSLMQEGKTDDAESVLKQAIAAIGGNPGLQLELAALYAGNDEFERAEGALKEAIRMEPQNPDLHITLGNFYAGIGKSDRAEAAFLNINVYYGEYDLAIDWDMTGPAKYQAISGFCVEDAWATSSNNVIYNLLLPPAAGPQYIAAAYILGQYQAGNISAQAAQIAVWETVMDFNNPKELSYGSGNFYALNPDSNDLAYINSALSFLETMPTLENFDSTSYRIARNGDNPSDGYQDYVIHVPEPGALLSLGIVLLGLGGVTRRRFKR